MIENLKKYFAEFIGTFVLVLFSCGTAVFVTTTGVEPAARILIIALAFGLSIVAMAYAIGHISGCHINPAVSFAMFILKKLSGKDLIGYVIAQVLGALAGSAILLAIGKMSGNADIADSMLGVYGLGANGFGSYVVDGPLFDVTVFYGIGLSAIGALIVEVILTFVFVLAIIGVTSSEKTSSIAGIVIGLVLTFVHILGIPLTGTSVNPARSLAPALVLAFGGEPLALSQVWVFIVGPLLGAALAALAAKYLFAAKK